MTYLLSFLLVFFFFFLPFIPKYLNLKYFFRKVHILIAIIKLLIVFFFYLFFLLPLNFHFVFSFQQSKETLSDLHATGFALLFSAGTFLYVATIHVLPEVANSSSSSSHDGVSIMREQKGFNKKELITFVIGSAIPVFLAVGHKH